MSYIASLIPCPYIPANFAVSSVVAEMNAEIASAAVSQAASTAVTTQTAAAVNASVAANTAASSSVAAGASTSIASTSAAASTSTVSASVAAISSVALPIAVSVMAILAAGMVIDVAKAQRELRRCHKLSIETVFTSREQLIDALFAQSGADECKIYEEKDGSLIVRYRLQDYFFRMNKKRGCFDLEIVNAQHPKDELEKINRIQQHYMEAVRRHSYESLMKTVTEQGWTVEEDETRKDGSRYISILI